MKLVFFLGLFLAASIFSFGQDAKVEKEQKAQQKKEQHVKVMVSQNGKTVKIDTTFNLPDEKLIQFKVDSILKKYGKGGMAAGDGKVIIMRRGNHLDKISEGKSLPGEEQFTVFYNSNDTGKVKHERKIIRMEKSGNSIVMHDLYGDMVPPPPPVPSVAGAHAVRVQGFRLPGGDPFSFNPEDKDIISYDKKDIGKGLEKITIVRKKQVEGTQKKDVEVKLEVQDEQKK
ncbi:MAG: hypothetical protein WCK18_03310 [Prolixibacteraceae bacterium]